MMLRRDALAALLLFVLFAAYGYLAMQIEVFPGQELEPFKPRTLPFTLAIAGMFLCAIRVLQTLRDKGHTAITWASYDWTSAALLCIAMLAYGFLFTRLGFAFATAIFLCTGFYILGERRPAALLLIPVIFTLVFWTIMTQLLGLYLAPGDWWSGFGK